MATIDLEFTDEELLRYSDMAHECELTLNEFFIRAIYSYLVRVQGEEIADLKGRMAKARGLLVEALGETPEET